MSEILSIHIGQAGIQVGNACWELFCLEHDIQPDGKVLQNPNDVKIDEFKSFYSETKTGQFVPRSLCLDIEQNAIDNIKHSAYKQLYDPESFVCANLEAANNFACGFYEINNQFFDACLDKIRKLTENCSDPQGFMIYSSLGGGTGSGLGSLLLQKIKDIYSKKTNLGLNIYPSDKISKRQEDSFNSVLSIQYLENNDANLVLDNEAIYDICKINLGIEQPTYTNLNKVIAQAVSSLTCNMRFDGGAILTKLDEIQKNLIPYHPLSFLLSSYSPFVAKDKNQNEFQLNEITSNAFQPCNMMAKCDPNLGYYLGLNVILRGNIRPCDSCRSMNQQTVRQGIKFPNWINHYRYAINYHTPVTIPGSEFISFDKSVFMISNSSSISQVLTRITENFDQILSKSELMQLYKHQGVEESEVIEARRNIVQLKDDYQLIENLEDDD
ncbi:hypothetical protein ABPG72_011508 [Tetrahymena utriculariae]